MNYPALDPFVEDRLEAFEAAVAARPNTPIDGFLPERSHAKFLTIATELIRVALELAWGRGQRMLLDEFHARYPELFRDEEIRNQLAFEEYRLRRLAGEEVLPSEYATRFGLSFATDAWSEWLGYDETAEAVGLSTKPKETRKSGLPQLAAGDEWHGFKIVYRLGSGSFANAYLATQDALADRPVVLKFSRFDRNEANKLSRLQHTNITPVHSVHEHDGVTVLCMPFLGRNTLSDLSRNLKLADRLPERGEFLIRQIAKSPAFSPRLVKLPSQPDLDEHGSSARVFYQENSYARSVLWMARSLAAGLQHSHERGILHRDIKPANVMLRDDGEPLLIDFNLAAETNQRADRAGGTMPYIAPETIRDMLRRSLGSEVSGSTISNTASGTATSKPIQSSDASNVASDIYSFGVVIYELLTGRLPFEAKKPNAAEGITDDYLRSVYNQRKSAAPSIRQLNPDVSCSAAQIIEKCLHLHPRDRYSSAKQLTEDLTAELDYLPLRHARNPSLKELVGKWVTRHPKICSWTTAAAAIVMVLTGSMFAWQKRELQLAKTMATNQLVRLRSEFETLRPSIVSMRKETINEQATLRSAESLAEAFHVASASLPKQIALHLNSRQREEFRELCKSLGYHLAEAHAVVATRALDSQTRQRELTAAFRWNEIANGYDTSDSSAIDFQAIRLKLVRDGLDHDSPTETQANTANSIAESAPTGGVQDMLLLGLEFMQREELDAAIKWLREATRKRPNDPAGWLPLADAHFRKGNYRESLAYIDVCVTLLPDSSLPFFERGRCHLELEQFENAVQDFSAAIEVLRNEENPSRTELDNIDQAQMNRALAYLGDGNTKAALADLTEVIERDSQNPRVYFVRARIRAQTGDIAGATKDREIGLKLRPLDDQGWMSRSHIRMTESPRAAVSDLERALAVTTNPRKIRENLAYVHSELLGETQKAVEFLSDSLKSNPADIMSRAGRGVLLARMGNFKEAIQDAETLLETGLDADARYRVACIFALSSQKDDSYRTKAIGHLAQSLIEDLRLLDVVSEDPDLADVRELQPVRELLAACRQIDKLTKTTDLEQNRAEHSLIEK